MFGDSFCREPRTGFLLRRYGAWDVAVALPEEAADQTGFALLVVMDGALHFDAAAAAARALARRSEKTDVGPTVVIGIASGPDWSHDGEARKRALPPDGADNAALRQALQRVIADVAALAPIDPARRAIFGHSFGGLFALDMLARSTDFGTCIAISPSLWHAPGLADDVARAITGRDARILLASGEGEPKINADLPAAAMTLSAMHRTLAGEDHGSIVFAALPLALRFLHGVVR